MRGYNLVNLKLMIDEIGEEEVKTYLSDFFCPLNSDVEKFLNSFKAIEFAKQGLAATHLVFTSYRDFPVLIGYFTLASKTIIIKKNRLNSNMKKRVKKFATYDDSLKQYSLSAPLIAQLGKNYNKEYNKLITGDELLKMACDKVKEIQLGRLS